MDEGYTQIEFIEDLTGKSPDLFAKKNDSTAILEVKTVNRSDEDIKNEALRKNEAIQVDPKLSKKFRNQIKRNIRGARVQLERYQNSASRKIIFFVYLHGVVPENVRCELLRTKNFYCRSKHKRSRNFLSSQSVNPNEIQIHQPSGCPANIRGYSAG